MVGSLVSTVSPLGFRRMLPEEPAHRQLLFCTHLQTNLSTSVEG